MDALFNIAVCDDDRNFVKVLHQKVDSIMSDAEYSYKVVELFNGVDLLQYCVENNVDFVLTDIDMPLVTGFTVTDALQSQQPDLYVIFITSHEELAYQAYDYHPYQFVCKRDLDKLDKTILKLIDKLKRQKNTVEILSLRDETDRIIDIDLNHTIYLKSSGHYLIPYTLSGEKEKFRCSMKDAYEQLSKADFVYVHRSYIVNCRYISKFNVREILLKDGTTISPSRNKDVVTEAQRLYMDFLRRLRD